MDTLTPYQKKLLDPRWQKKRLEILQRDNFSCQSCCDNKKTLHIHHKIYQNCDPWDYDDKYLITLCDECHYIETESVKKFSTPVFKLLLKIGFLAKDFDWFLDKNLDEIKLLHLPEVVLSAWFESLINPKTQRYIIDEYLRPEREAIQKFLEKEILEDM